jgi:hypothetical protein
MIVSNHWLPFDAYTDLKILNSVLQNVDKEYNINFL